MTPYVFVCECGKCEKRLSESEYSTALDIILNSKEEDWNRWILAKTCPNTMNFKSLNIYKDFIIAWGWFKHYD